MIPKEQIINLEGLFNNTLKEFLNRNKIITSTKKYLTSMKKHDINTYAHELRVALLAKRLAEFCGYTDTKPELFGGANHDVGKLKISSKILNQENFSDEDFGLIKKHPEFGMNDLRQYLFISMIAGLHHSIQKNSYGIKNDYLDKMPIEIKTRLLDAVTNVALADFFDAINTRANNYLEPLSSIKDIMNKVYPDFRDRIDFLFSDKASLCIVKPFCNGNSLDIKGAVC